MRAPALPAAKIPPQCPQTRPARFHIVSSTSSGQSVHRRTPPNPMIGTLPLLFQSGTDSRHTAIHSRPRNSPQDVCAPIQRSDAGFMVALASNPCISTYQAFPVRCNRHTTTRASEPASLFPPLMPSRARTSSSSAGVSIRDAHTDARCKRNLTSPSQ
jgi:hypothetical protein